MEVRRDLTHWHRVAWRYGRDHFVYPADAVPNPRGLVVGEGPGPHTDVRLPLFPLPRNSAAGRLLAYSGLSPSEYLGRLVRANLCDTPRWTLRKARGELVNVLAWLLDPDNFHAGSPLRVLLLGRRVADVWGCTAGAFGTTVQVDGLAVTWIPHPSGRNLAYNHAVNRAKARTAVRWSVGLRSTPW